MLKISVEPTVREVHLKLEGELTGRWVLELEACWRAACSSFASRPVRIDLTDCVRVDDAGQYLLALLHGNGARLFSADIATSGLIESLMRDWPSRQQA